MTGELAWKLKSELVIHLDQSDRLVIIAASFQSAGKAWLGNASRSG